MHMKVTPILVVAGTGYNSQLTIDTLGWFIGVMIMVVVYFLWFYFHEKGKMNANHNHLLLA